MEYKDTIFLPKTSFEMRANLPMKEPKILKEWNNQNIFNYVDESPYTNKDKLFKRYDFLSKGAPPESNQEWLNWAIKLKNSNDYLGLLQATIYKNQKTEIGYLLSPKYWSNGYGTEAVNYLCKYLFKYKNVKNNRPKCSICS